MERYLSTAKQVPAFSHGNHVGKALADGTELGCVQCHSWNPNGNPGQDGPEIGVLPEAMNCTLCHDHSETADRPGPRSPLTGGGVTEAEIQACSTCHVGGIPGPDERFEIATARLVNIEGNSRQYHPSNQDCATCHLDTQGLLAASSGETHSRLFAARSFYADPDRGIQVPTVHRGGTRKLGQDDVTCYWCHWTNNLVDVLSSGSGTPDPELPGARNRVGDKLDKYPGGAFESSLR